MQKRPWLETYGPRIPHEIDPGAYRSVVHLLEGAMDRYAERPAFCWAGQVLTYADTERLSRAFAAFLQVRAGVKRGDRIAVMLPNIPAFPIAMMGILRAGAAQVNVNPLYTPRELEHQLNDSGSEIIVVFDGVAGTLAEVIGATGIRRVINVGLADGTHADAPASGPDPRFADAVPFSAALALGATLPLVGFLVRRGGAVRRPAAEPRCLRHGCHRVPADPNR